MTPMPLIFAATCDIAGKVRGKAFPADQLERRLSRGVGWVPTNVQINCFDGIGDSPFGALGDLLLVPDPDAEVRLAFGDQPPEHFMLGNIVTLDGDLQNDPQDIPRLIDRIDEGHDLVLGWRKHRRDPLWSRTLPSRIANALIGRITGVNVHDSGCSLKAYRAEMIKQVPLYSEMHRFIPAMSTLRSARISEVVVNHFPRQRGKSKYGLYRVGKVLLDVVAIKMLISFRHQPLRYFARWATPCFVLALAIAGVDLAQRWTGSEAAFLVHPITSLLLLTKAKSTSVAKPTSPMM